MWGIWPGFAPGSVGATQQAWIVAVAGLSPLRGAPALFVTEKTVETHPGRAFRKLNINSRRRLPDVLLAAASRRHDARVVPGPTLGSLVEGPVRMEDGSAGTTTGQGEAKCSLTT